MHTADSTATQLNQGELRWEFIYLFVLYPSLATHQHIYTHTTHTQHTYNTHTTHTQHTITAPPQTRLARWLRYTAIHLPSIPK